MWFIVTHNAKLKQQGEDSTTPCIGTAQCAGGIGEEGGEIIYELYTLILFY